MRSSRHLSCGSPDAFSFSPCRRRSSPLDGFFSSLRVRPAGTLPQPNFLTAGLLEENPKFPHPLLRPLDPSLFSDLDPSTHTWDDHPQAIRSDLRVGGGNPWR